MRMVLKPVEGLVEVAAVAARADGNQREQVRIARSIGAHGGGAEATHLRQRVVEDVGQAVAVGDQVLDGVEPAVIATALVCAIRPSSLGITIREKNRR